MTHLHISENPIYLDGGWGWWWRVELVGGTHPGGREELAGGTHPGARIVRSACGRDPPIYKKINQPGVVFQVALILPHCYCKILY